jgi:N-acetylglucosaminyl-diphospho-decaprenol L-rhamnosyltransferase
MSPLVTAIILNYRTPKETVCCVHALIDQGLGDDMEILVVDNHSNDESIGILHARLRDLPNVRILESKENAGFGRGYNIGLRQAKGTYVLLNNPSKILSKGSIEAMATLLKNDPSIGIVGPKLRHSDGSLRSSARALPSPVDVLIKRTFLRSLFPARIARYLQTKEHPDKMRDADWVIGGCLMMPRALMEDIGGFDPRFFLFFEDIDLCRECWKRGKRVVYFPMATALDRKRRLSEGGVFSLLGSMVGRAHIASGWKYFRKWGVS